LWTGEPDTEARKATMTTKCTKCDGHGYIAAYKHVAGGQCFRCNGGSIGRKSLAVDKAEQAAFDAAHDDYLADLAESFC
jgi:hypothetical protein